MERASVELDIMDHPVLSHVNLVPSAKAVCGNVYVRTLPNVILNPVNVHVTMDGQESIVITVECTYGHYGVGCEQICSCPVNQQCHHVTGKCSCLPGKMGIHCNETCPPGKFGVGCLQYCECTTCNPETGAFPVFTGHAPVSGLQVVHSQY